MDASDVFERAWELLGRLETVLAEYSRRALEIRTRDERQEFLDRAALASTAARRSPRDCFLLAEQLWLLREWQRGQPSERELVVRYLGLEENQSASVPFLQDAIKRGEHVNPTPPCPQCGAGCPNGP